MKAFSLIATMNTLVMMINGRKGNDEHIEVELWPRKWALNGDNHGDDESIEHKNCVIDDCDNE